MRHTLVLLFGVTLSFLAMLFGCFKSRVEERDGLIFVRTAEANLVVMSPEYLRTILPTTHQNDHLAYVAIGNLQFEYHNLVFRTMIETSYWPWSHIFPMTVSSPRFYEGRRVLKRNFRVLCVDCQEGRYFEVDFMAKRIDQVSVAHLSPADIKRILDMSLSPHLSKRK